MNWQWWADLTLERLAPLAVLVVGASVLSVGLYMLVRSHLSRSPIDLHYLLLDGTLNPPRVTLAKAAGLGAFLASTWWITWLVVSGKADGTMIAAYIAGWGGVKVAGDFTSLRERAMVARVDDPDA